MYWGPHAPPAWQIQSLRDIRQYLTFRTKGTCQRWSSWWLGSCSGILCLKRMWMSFTIVFTCQGIRAWTPPQRIPCSLGDVNSCAWNRRWAAAWWTGSVTTISVQISLCSKSVRREETNFFLFTHFTRHMYCSCNGEDYSTLQLYNCLKSKKDHARWSNFRSSRF